MTPCATPHRAYAAPKAPPRLAAIPDVAKQLGVTARALRFYQDQGLVRSHRLARSVRAYDQETIERLRRIVALRDAGLPVSTIREILALDADPVAQRTAMREALIEVLADKQRQIAHIEALLNKASGLSGLEATDAASTPRRRDE